MITIGSYTLKSKCVLAPLAGVSDLPFRLINRRFGCSLAFVEMINARSLTHKSRRTRQMLASGPQDRPLGVQLLGCEPGFISKAVSVLNEYDFELLDFNAACPAKKVVRRGEGAALLKDPPKLASLFKLLVKSSRVPVTAKIRSGWDRDSVVAPEVARMLEDAGAAAVFVHGRTRMQGYAGGVDYRAIRDVKKAVRIPVIASGDVWSAEFAKKMFDETGCDGVAVARGSLGNPWIFREIEAVMQGRSLPQRPSVAQVVEVMKEHLRLSVEYHGERNGVMIYRKFFAWYSKGWRGVRPLRERCSRVKTPAEMLELIDCCGREAH